MSQILSFVARKHNKTAKMETLLVMARQGESRPAVSSPLGIAVGAYTNRSHPAFEAAFSQTLRALRPDWFRRGRPVVTDLRAIQQSLIQQALAGEHVGSRHPHYVRLRNFTNPQHSQYDAGFAKLISLLAPSWSSTAREVRSDRETNKQALMMLASAGRAKPSRKTKLGQVLSTYVSEAHRSYDAAFAFRLIRLRPDWFGLRTVSVTDVPLAA